MGFMANFWGSAAVAGDQTQRDWRQLWMQEEQLEEQKRQNQINTDHAQQQLDIQRGQADETRRVNTFNQRIAYANLSLANRSADMQDEEFNLNWANSFFDSNMEAAFEGASYLEQMSMAQSARGTFAANPYGMAKADAWEQRIHDRPMEPEVAMQVLEQYYDPYLQDSAGNFVAVSPARANAALKSLEGHFTYDDYKNQFDEVNARREEDPEYGAGLNQRFREAELRDVETNTEYRVALTGNVEQDTQTMADAAQRAADLFPLQREQISLENTQLGLSNDLRSIELKYADQLARYTVDSVLADLQGQKLSNEQHRNTMDAIIRTVASQADITEAEARVAVETADFRIRASELTNDQISATIESIKSSTANDTARLGLATLDMLGSLMATGNTALVSTHAEALLRPEFGDNWESALETITGYTADRRGEIELREGLDAGYVMAQTNESLTRAANIAEDTRLMGPRQALNEQVAADNSARGWATHNLNVDEFNYRMARDKAADAAAAAINADRFAGVGGMFGVESVGDILDLMELDDGTRHFSNSLASLESMKADLRVVGLAAEFNTNSDATANWMNTVAPILARHGISIPEGQFGQDGTPSQKAIQIARDALQAKISQEEILWSTDYAQFTTLLGATAPSDMQNVAETLGLNMGNSYLQGLMERSFDTSVTGQLFNREAALTDASLAASDVGVEVWIRENAHTLANAMLPGDAHNQAVFESLLDSGAFEDEAAAELYVNATGLNPEELSLILSEVAEDRMDMLVTAVQGHTTLFPNQSTLDLSSPDRAMGAVNQARNYATYVNDAAVNVPARIRSGEFNFGAWNPNEPAVLSGQEAMVSELTTMLGTTPEQMVAAGLISPATRTSTNVGGTGQWGDAPNGYTFNPDAIAAALTARSQEALQHYAVVGAFVNTYGPTD